MYKVGARYQGTFGPVALYGFGAYIGSGHVNVPGFTRHQAAASTASSRV